MFGDYSYVLDGLPDVLILERWPNNRSANSWQSAQMFALVLDQGGEWSLEKRQIVADRDNRAFDVRYKLTIVLPVLDSIKFACRLDLEKLRAGISKGGELAAHMFEIESGRTLYWSYHHQEEVGKLNEEAKEALNSWKSIVDEETYFTSDTVLTVTEHLLGKFYEESPRSVMRRYGLRKNSSAKRIAAVAKKMKRSFSARRTLAYGSYESAIKEIIGLETGLPKSDSSSACAVS
jgi:hypothetical protein